MLVGRRGRAALQGRVSRWESMWALALVVAFPWQFAPSRLCSGAVRTFDSRDIYQPISDGVHHQLSGLVNAERVHDVGTMNRDRIRTET